jgi:hypothetical protein
LSWPVLISMKVMVISMSEIKYTKDQEDVLAAFDTALTTFRQASVEPCFLEGQVLLNIVNKLDEDLKTLFVFERYLTPHTIKYITKQLNLINKNVRVRTESYTV